MVGLLGGSHQPILNSSSTAALIPQHLSYPYPNDHPKHLSMSSLLTTTLQFSPNDLSSEPVLMDHPFPPSSHKTLLGTRTAWGPQGVVHEYGGGGGTLVYIQSCLPPHLRPSTMIPVSHSNFLHLQCFNVSLLQLPLF